MSQADMGSTNAISFWDANGHYWPMAIGLAARLVATTVVDGLNRDDKKRFIGVGHIRRSSSRRRWRAAPRHRPCMGLSRFQWPTSSMSRTIPSLSACQMNSYAGIADVGR